MLAMKKMIEDELMPMGEVNRLLAGNLSGIDTRYTAAVSQHDLVGRRLPNIGLRDQAGAQTSVFELLHHQAFLLLDVTGGDVPPLAEDVARRVVVASSLPGEQHTCLSGLSALLVRPDGHVAWAGRRPLPEGLPAAELDRWELT